MARIEFDVLAELEEPLIERDPVAELWLFESIAISGVLEAVKLARVEGYPRPILIDGHKRYRITERLKLALPIDETIPGFASLDDVKLWRLNQPTFCRS
jgi:hypothetical protein